MNKAGELWTAGDIAAWLGISMPAVYALVSEEGFPLPVRGLAHSRRWSQTVVRQWVTTPRFASDVEIAGSPQSRRRARANRDANSDAIIVRPLRSPGSKTR